MTPVRRLVKQTADVLAMALAAPFGLLSMAEHRWLSPSEGVFHICGHTLALVPGLPGAYVRRAFYRYALDGCHPECHIGFGAFVTHREVIIERGVYVGCWALVGSAHLREGTSIGSRASLLSGTELHEYVDGRWTPYDHRKLRQISVGPHTLVGEGAIVMADVGPSALVSAGAVVANSVPGWVVVAGNPARFVRRIEITRVNGSPDVAVGQ